MRFSSHRLPLAGLLLVLVACADAPLPTQAPSSPETAFFSRPPAPGFDAVARLTPLEQELVVSRTIGSAGGRLEIAEAGIVFVVPEGALSVPVAITMTALAGREMAFDFQPHGLRFLKPPTIKLDLRATTAAGHLPALEPTAVQGTSLERFLGVYFTGDPARGVEPLEVLPAYRSRDGVAFDIRHFSGYVCATG
jgi:hypothetical protein